MDGLSYRSSRLYGRVRSMRSVPLLYSFVVALASSFALATHALAENRLSGFVFASDGCQLQPPSFAEACITALVPISGKLAVRQRGGRTRQVVSLSSSGTFTTSLKPGRYNVRLLEGRSGELTLRGQQFRIAPAVVSIPKKGESSHNSVYFAVSHRSRPATPFIGVSNGCEGK